MTIDLRSLTWAEKTQEVNKARLHGVERFLLFDSRSVTYIRRP